MVREILKIKKVRLLSEHSTLNFDLAVAGLFVHVIKKNSVCARVCVCVVGGSCSLYSPTTIEKL